MGDEKPAVGPSRFGQPPPRNGGKGPSSPLDEVFGKIEVFSCEQETDRILSTFAGPQDSPKASNADAGAWCSNMDADNNSWDGYDT